jgi:hypothetical protein
MRSRKAWRTPARTSCRDQAWRPGLESLRDLARLRIVHCVVDADVAWHRRLRRSQQDPLRRAHPDPGPGDAAAVMRRHREFDRVSVPAPWIEVDTADGYQPGLDEITAFVSGGP